MFFRLLILWRKQKRKRFASKFFLPSPEIRRYKRSKWLWFWYISWCSSVSDSRKAKFLVQTLLLLLVGTEKLKVCFLLLISIYMHLALVLLIQLLMTFWVFLYLKKCLVLYFSSLGQNLKTSTFVGEILFAVFISIIGLILFSLLIGNMQVSTVTLYYTILNKWIRLDWNFELHMTIYFVIHFHLQQICLQLRFSVATNIVATKCSNICRLDCIFTFFGGDFLSQPLYSKYVAFVLSPPFQPIIDRDFTDAEACVCSDIFWML